MAASDLMEVPCFRLPDGAEVSISAVLAAGRPLFLIGSDPRSALRLEGAAPAHAAVSFKDSIYAIQPRYPDLEVQVNGERISGPQPLRPGDSVQIGATTLTFDQTGRAPQAGLALAETAAPETVVLSTPMFISETTFDYAAPAAEPVIYRPRQQVTSQNPLGLIFGLVAILGILVAVGLSLFAGNQTRPSISQQFAFNDGNVTLLMFDADW